MKRLGFYTRLIAIFWLFGLVIYSFGESWLSNDLPVFQSDEPETNPMIVKPLSQIAEEAKPRGPNVQFEPGRRGAAMYEKDGWGGDSWDEAPSKREDEESDWGAAVR